MPRLFDDGRYVKRGGVERVPRNMKPEPCIYIIYMITERTPRSQTAGSLKTAHGGGIGQEVCYKNRETVMAERLTPQNDTSTRFAVNCKQGYKTGGVEY